MEIVDQVRELIADYLDREGVELVEVTYRREQSGMVLRLLVDTPEGITVDECEEINNFVSEVLDKENTINERYTIEVSSPGLDRPIKTARDFERAMGKVLDVTTYEPIDGKKTHEGRLVGMSDDCIVLERNGVSTEIPRGRIARAVLKIEF
jgi:ribosome maturation factor RimP